VVENIQTQHGAKIMTMDFQTKRIFQLGAAESAPTVTGLPKQNGPSLPVRTLVLLMAGK